MTLSIANKIRRWHRAGATRRELNALSAAQLADIGLDRGQIEDVARSLTARQTTARNTSVVTSVERGMNLSPLFHAYLPRAR